MEKSIQTTYETITEESAKNGDFADCGWEDQEGISMMPDKYDIEEGINTIDLAVKYLKENGPMEASANFFHQGIWYIHYSEMDVHSGEYKNLSYHLKGFSELEEKAIFEKMNKRNY